MKIQTGRRAKAHADGWGPIYNTDRKWITISDLSGAQLKKLVSLVVKEYPKQINHLVLPTCSCCQEFMGMVLIEFLEYDKRFIDLFRSRVEALSRGNRNG